MLFKINSNSNYFIFLNFLFVSYSSQFYFYNILLLAQVILISSLFFSHAIIPRRFLAFTYLLLILAYLFAIFTYLFFLYNILLLLPINFYFFFKAPLNTSCISFFLNVFIYNLNHFPFSSYCLFILLFRTSNSWPSFNK